MNLIQVLLMIPVFIACMFACYVLNTDSDSGYKPLHTRNPFDLAWDVLSWIFVSVFIAWIVVIGWWVILIVVGIVGVVYASGFGLRKACEMLNI